MVFFSSIFSPCNLLPKENNVPRKWKGLEEALWLEALSSWCGEAQIPCSRAPRSPFHRLSIGQERPGRSKAFAFEDQAD